MPGEHRMTADQAMMFVGTLEERLTTVALEAAEYYAGL
jgi:hypothetical protein